MRRHLTLAIALLGVWLALGASVAQADKLRIVTTTTDLKALPRHDCEATELSFGVVEDDLDSPRELPHVFERLATAAHQPTVTLVRQDGSGLRNLGPASFGGQPSKT